MLLLLALLLLFLLRHLVPDHASGGGARDGMMAGDVASDAANHRAAASVLWEWLPGGQRVVEHHPRAAERPCQGQLLPRRWVKAVVISELHVYRILV